MWWGTGVHWTHIAKFFILMNVNDVLSLAKVCDLTKFALSEHDAARCQISVQNLRGRDGTCHVRQDRSSEIQSSIGQVDLTSAHAMTRAYSGR